MREHGVNSAENFLTGAIDSMRALFRQDMSWLLALAAVGALFFWWMAKK